MGLMKFVEFQSKKLSEKKERNAIKPIHRMYRTTKTTDFASSTTPSVPLVQPVPHPLSAGNWVYNKTNLSTSRCIN